MADVWDENWYGSTKTLDVTIGRLRQKLESVGVTDRVVAVRGVGFRLEGGTPMRERLTAAFVLLTVVPLLAGGVVRSFVLRDLIREQESSHLHQEVELVAAIADDRSRRVAWSTRRSLQSVVGDEARIQYDSGHGETLVAHGDEYVGTDDP